MGRKITQTFFVFCIVICSAFIFSAPRAHASNVGESLYKNTASVISSITDFFSVLFGGKNTPALAPVVTPAIPVPTTNPAPVAAAPIIKYYANPAATKTVTKYFTVHQTINPDLVTKSQLSFSLQLLENRVNSAISSVSGSGRTVPPNFIIPAIPDVTKLSPSTLNVIGNATSSFSNGINLSSGCFAISNVCLGGGSGGGVWGTITGTLSSQVDLQTALNTKLNTSAFGNSF
jgi:hypothetical protein